MRGIISIILALIIFTTSFSSAEDFSGGSITAVNPEQMQSDGITPDQSQLVNSLCTLILILNGRIARVLAAVAIFAVGIMFFLGKITWPVLTTIGVAMGLVFGAKTVAIIMLPRAVYVHDAYQEETLVKTPSEIISQACPELK